MEFVKVWAGVLVGFLTISLLIGILSALLFNALARLPLQKLSNLRIFNRHRKEYENEGTM